MFLITTILPLHNYLAKVAFVPLDCIFVIALMRLKRRKKNVAQVIVDPFGTTTVRITFYMVCYDRQLVVPMPKTSLQNSTVDLN